MPPKQVVEIRKFTKGMVTNVDVTDPPIDTPIYTKGLETHNAVGSLSGSPVDEGIFSSLAIETGIPFTFHDNDLIFAISTQGIYYILSDLYTSPSWKFINPNGTSNNPGVTP